MMSWGVSTDTRALAEALAPYLDEPIAIDARERSLWQANGLRIVCIPLDRLDALRQLLPQTGGVQRQWLGQVTQWTDVVHGSPWPEFQAVTMDNGRLDLGPGRLRLLLRCWTMPVPAAGAVRTAMRTEFLIQHQEPSRPTDLGALYTKPVTIPDPLDEGLLFRRLTTSVTLPPDRALILIPESPQTDWKSLASIPADQLEPDHATLAETRPPPEDPPPDAGPVGVGQVLRERPDQRPQPAPQPIETPGPIDPAIQRARTLGELLLTPGRARVSTAVGDRPVIRSVLVLVPRVSETYSIEAPAPSPTK